MISLICGYKSIVLIEPESTMVFSGTGESDWEKGVGKFIYCLKVKLIEKEKF